MEQITPLKDYIILELPARIGQKIVLPENHEPLKLGTAELVVWKCGPGCKRVRPGDKLIFNPEEAVTIAFQGKQYFLTREFAVGCIVREEERWWEKWARCLLR